MENRVLKIQTLAIPIVTIMVMSLFFYYAKPILVPIVLGITFAFILNPAVKLLKRIRVPHVLAVVIVVIVALAIFLSIAVLIGSQASELVVQSPQYWVAFQERLAQFLDKFPSLTQFLPGDLSKETATGMLENIKWKDIASFSRFLFSGLGSAIALLGQAVLVLLITLFVLIEQAGFKNNLAHLFGSEHTEASEEMINQISDNVSGFLSVRFTTTFALAVVVTIGLLIMGVPYAYVWGPMAGLLNLVPYVGAVIGAIPPMIVASIEYKSMWWFLYIGIFFFVLQFLEGNIVTPKLVGNRINLNLTAVLIATLYWGWLWGGVGVILALPITATFKVITEHVESLRPIGNLLDGSFRA